MPTKEQIAVSLRRSATCSIWYFLGLLVTLLPLAAGASASAAFLFIILSMTPPPTTSSFLSAQDAFALLASSNRYAAARAQDATLRAYIGLWKNGLLSPAKMKAILAKYGFQDYYMPPQQNPPTI